MAHALTAVVAAITLVACGDAGTSPDDTSTSTSPDDTSTSTSPDDTSTSTDASTSTDTSTSPDDTSTSTETSTSPDDTSTGDTTATADADADPGPDLAGACLLPVRLGGFQAVDDGEYGYVDGTISDAVLPVSVLDVVATDGDCTLYRKTNPFCSPPCGPSETCADDGHCIAYPAPQDLGTVTVTGLDAGAVVMEPVQPGNLYYATDVPYPPWTPGAALTLTTEGGAFAALTLDGVAPAPLTPGESTWTLTAGAALTAHWDAPAGPVRTRVELQLLIDQHGNAPGSLRCDFADDGEATVPAGILDQLLALGVSGFPSGKLVRQTVDSTAVGATGCADFAARAPRSVKVVVSGHIPCKKNQDCPLTAHCDLPTETCVPN